MLSACGDGWRDEAGGEACDDFEALAGGARNADCSAVNDGWICGERAEGCAPDPDAVEPDAGGDAGSGDVGGADAAVADVEGRDDSDAGGAAPVEGDDSGCSAAPGATSGFGAVLVALALVSRRRRR